MPLTIRFIGLDDDQYDMVRGYFGLFTNQLFANFATVLGNDYTDYTLNIDSDNYYKTLNITRDSENVVAFSREYDLPLTTYQYGTNIKLDHIKLDEMLNVVGSINTGDAYNDTGYFYDSCQNILMSAIAPYAGTDCNSIAVEYDSNSRKFYGYCQQIDGYNVYFTSIDYDRKVVYPSADTKVVINQNQFVPVIQFDSLSIHSNDIEAYKYTYRYERVNGAPISQIQQQLIDCFPDAQVGIPLDSVDYISMEESSVITAYTSENFINEEPDDWNQYISTLYSNYMILPLIDTYISSGTIEIQISKQENPKLTLPITCEWDPEVAGPSLSKSIDAYVTTPASTIKLEIKKTTVPEYINITKLALIPSADNINNDTTGIKITKFEEEFVTPNHIANHIIKLNSTIGELCKKISVGSSYVYIYCHGTVEYLYENFTFEKRGTLKPNNGTWETYEIVVYWDDNVGWYVDKIYPCKWCTPSIETNCSAGNIGYISTLRPVSFTGEFIVKNEEVQYIWSADELFDEGGLTCSINYQTPETVVISKDKNFWNNYKDVTTWNQLPAEFRNIINRNWSVDIKETEWEG